MQNQLERIQQIAGMQRNFLRDFVPADAPESRMTEGNPSSPRRLFRIRHRREWHMCRTSSGKSRMMRTQLFPSGQCSRRWIILTEEVALLHEKQRLMAMIRKYDFVLYELQLYLDTHPRCPEALRMWKNYQAMRQKAASAYIRQYSPIQPLQTDGNAPWAWNQGPWPWEKEAN